MIYFDKLKKKPLFFSNLVASSILLSLLPSEAFSSGYYIQAGSYKVFSNAQRSLTELEKRSHEKGRIVKVTHNNESYYNVQFGNYSEFQVAKRAQKNINKFVKSAFIKNYKNNLTEVPTVAKQVTMRKSAKVTVLPSSSAPILSSSNNRERGLAPTTSFLSSLYTPSRFPYNPRALADGALSTRHSFFNGDLMLPVIGNNDVIGFIDGGGKYADSDAWFGTFGGGVRIVNGNRLWGGYFFADYNNSYDNKSFVIGNPGLELFMNNWDGHLNGYIPMNGKSKSLGIFKGDQIGRPHSFYFESHTFHEYLFNVMDTTGPGFDGEVGYTLPFFNVRPFLGGYHFNMSQMSNINGVQGGIEVPIASNFTLRIHDAYDNIQKNAFLGTLRLTFGELPPNRQDVHSHMLDPFRRNLGSYQTGNGLPIVKTTKRLSRTEDTANVWFFAPTGSAFTLANGFSNCTFENPCNEFSQVAIDGINTLALNSHFFIDSGTYNNPLVGTGFALHAGQGINGRTNHFIDIAYGSARPLLNDSLLLPGFNTIKNVSVNGQTVVPELVGIQAIPGAVGNIDIANSLIKVEGSNTAFSLQAISSVNNNATITLTDSDVVANLSNSPVYSPTGLYLQNSGQLVMTGGTVNVSGDNVNSISGAHLDNTQSILQGVTINASENGDAPGGAVGIGAIADLFFIDSQLNISANNNSTTGSVTGISKSGALNILNSLVNVRALNNNGSTVKGIDSSNNVNLLINSRVNVEVVNSSSFVAGINVTSTSSPTFLLNSQINLLGNNSGNLNGLLGIDSDGPIYMNNSAIQVAGFNGSGGLFGIQSHSGAPIAYGASNISLLTDTSNVVFVLNSGTITNFGSVFCTSVVNGVVTTGPCPG